MPKSVEVAPNRMRGRRAFEEPVPLYSGRWGPM